jgi:hypothetical protein
MDDLIARLRAGTVTPADLDAAADALEDGSFYQEKDIDAMQARIRELEAQLAAPAVKVTPLVWGDWADVPVRVASAQTILGRYKVQERASGAGCMLVFPNGNLTNRDTIEAAKAAAQADYEARILATIEAVPVAEVWRRAMEAAAQAVEQACTVNEGDDHDAYCAGFMCGAKHQNRSDAAAVRALPMPDDLK